MARPKRLNYKTRFSVVDRGGSFDLVYRPNFNDRRTRILYSSSNRSALYRERMKYSSWFDRITSLLKSYEE